MPQLPSPRQKDEAAFEAASVIFIEENGEAPGLRLRNGPNPTLLLVRQPRHRHPGGYPAGMRTALAALAVAIGGAQKA
ncbi:hypothetical protein [Methylobacterium sp. J-070]|uniref:hypothetical protein n=1 Tax=Methylobacterium sp. J-070 TaxID=2836650 RepID=UPI001FB8DD0B|nr:hypothetical protein [Methylobacterium sp. J-070]MCJ2052099.1 hypothetical protein [Methylobacterium sp. J-070]